MKNENTSLKNQVNTQMDERQYFENRLDRQIAWYSKESTKNKRWFKSLRIVEIISAALIPFLSAFSNRYWLIPYFIGGLGIVIAISASLNGLNRYQELWQKYRSTCESLKHEKFFFMTKCDPYNNDDAFCFLVDRVEALISAEHSGWIKIVGRKDEKKDHDATPKEN